MGNESYGLPPFTLRLNLILFLLTWLSGICYAAFGGLVFKIPASLCFFLLGCLNTNHVFRQKRSPGAYPWILLAGLFSGFLADIVLELHFLGGAALFALGHLFYLSAYCCLLPLMCRDIRICTGVFVPCLGLILFLPALDFGGSFMKGIVIVYTMIICLMLGKSLANYLRKPCRMTLCLLVGSILFFFSDFMLLFAFFTDAGRITNILCLNTYYPGQAILAGSIFLRAYSD